MHAHSPFTKNISVPNNWLAISRQETRSFLSLGERLKEPRFLGIPFSLHGGAHSVSHLRLNFAVGSALLPACGESSAVPSCNPAALARRRVGLVVWECTPVENRAVSSPLVLSAAPCLVSVLDSAAEGRNRRLAANGGSPVREWWDLLRHLLRIDHPSLNFYIV